MKRKTVVWLVVPFLPLAAASARPPVDSVPGVSDGPSLNWSQQKLVTNGYENRAKVNGSTSGDRIMTFGTDGADGKVVPLSIDPLTGKQLNTQ